MEKQFNKYLNGTANPDEFSEVLNALCTEDNNGKVTVEILKLWKDTLKAAIENKENSQLLDKIHHRIALEESKTIARRFTLYLNLLKVAAILITGLIISTLFLYVKPEKQFNLATIETVTTPYDARTSFKLPDGSEVWLNSGSTISFPKQYGQIRNVELIGEAYFKILKDGKSFIVKTNLGTIEVMATSFDLKAFKNDNFTTTLVEGSVIVKSMTNQLTTLKPGQQSVITPTNEFSMKVVNTDLSNS